MIALIYTGPHRCPPNDDVRIRTFDFNTFIAGPAQSFLTKGAIRIC